RAGDQRDLPTILDQLRLVAPNAEITVTGSWDSFLGAVEFADPLFQTLNMAITQVAAAKRAWFVDPFPIFNPKGDLNAEQQATCTLTLLCTLGDSHPSDARAIQLSRMWSPSGPWQRVQLFPYCWWPISIFEAVYSAAETARTAKAMAW